MLHQIPAFSAGWTHANKQTDLLQTFCKEKMGTQGKEEVTKFMSYILNNFEDFIGCFDENTFGLNETIFDAFQDTINRKDIPLNSSSWKVIKGSVLQGQCHTYQHPILLGADQTKDGIDFALLPDVPYLIFIHDPNFYLFASNPMIFPSMWKESKVSTNESR